MSHCLWGLGVDYRPPEEAKEVWFRDRPATLRPVKVARLRPFSFSTSVSLSAGKKKKQTNLKLSDLIGLTSSVILCFAPAVYSCILLTQQRRCPLALLLIR